MLNNSGMCLLPVRTLEDLRHALTTANTVVVRLVDNVDLLKEVLHLVQAFRKQIPIVCRVSSGEMSLAIEAMRTGAAHVVGSTDFTEQTWNEIRGLAVEIESVRESETSVSQESPERRAIGKSADRPISKSFVFADPLSQKVFALARRVGQANVATLLTGPTGAGKEVFATIIHESSDRHTGPFVSLNCGAIPENLMEDMLFGHERGAFTGAHKEHRGIFEQAHGGTVFLDEIGELPMQMQSKLLRVLQEKKVTRLGGGQSISVDFRLIAATNKDLKKGILEKEFREDLYFRISTFRIAIPALRERRGDIPAIAQALMSKYSQQDDPQLSREALDALTTYDWPGNVREMENVIQRALLINGHRRIDREHLIFDDTDCIDLEPQPSASSPDLTLPRDGFELNEEARQPVQAAFDASASSGAIRLRDFARSSEHQMILRAIEAAPTKAEAAKMLGISPRTLRYKMAQLKMAGAA